MKLHYIATYNCLHCGELNENKKNTAAKYCNNKCQQDYQYQKKIDEWKSGGPITSRTVKRYLMELKNECWTCGISEWNKQPITLELEHKDGNHENNSEQNLCLLCPNCHSQTPTYKARNVGNGRAWRMQRYREGKSY